MKKSNKKLIKILTILALAIVLISCCTAAVFAGSYHVSNIEPTSVPFAGIIISVVQVCCYAAAVIWIMIIGLKYLSASPDGKAEIKKQLFAAFIGGLILFSIGSIIAWIYAMVPKS
jgi:ABC-type cobalt transport system substrate-binding protein